MTVFGFNQLSVIRSNPFTNNIKPKSTIVQSKTYLLTQLTALSGTSVFLKYLLNYLNLNSDQLF